MNERIQVMNATYTNMSCQELLDAAVSRVKTRDTATIIFLNVDVVMKLEKDAYLARIVEEAEYVLADGMPLIWISKLLHRGLKEKVSGSDFVPLLCERASVSSWSEGPRALRRRRSNSSSSAIQASG